MPANSRWDLIRGLKGQSFRFLHVYLRRPYHFMSVCVFGLTASALFIVF